VPAAAAVTIFIKDRVAATFGTAHFESADEQPAAGNYATAHQSARDPRNSK
jgi:hypothetical protein